MNLREWARATHRALADRPEDERQKEFTMTDVEWILRESLTTLTNILVAGEDLRVADLGCLWVEDRPGKNIASNLPDRAKTYRLPTRRVVRFRSSKKLKARLSAARND
jgi:nucleoid DNA-binding protein